MLEVTKLRRLAAVAAFVIAVWSLLPIYWLVNLSFQTRRDTYAVPANLYPLHPTLENVYFALGIMRIPGGGIFVQNFQSGIVNSIMIASIVTAFTMIVSIPAGYAFSRYNFAFRSSVFFLVLFARMIPPVSELITYYQFYKSVNLLGTYQGLIMAHLTLTLPLATWVISGIFASIPTELDRQARVDGCTRLTTVRRILIPAAAPGLIAIAIVSWLTSWNEWVLALYLADSRGLRTVSAVAGGFPAFVMVGIIPPVIAAFFLQRYMTRLRLLSPLTIAAGSDVPSQH